MDSRQALEIYKEAYSRKEAGILNMLSKAGGMMGKGAKTFAGAGVNTAGKGIDMAKLAAKEPVPFKPANAAELAQAGIKPESIPTNKLFNNDVSAMDKAADKFNKGVRSGTTVAQPIERGAAKAPVEYAGRAPNKDGLATVPWQKGYNPNSPIEYAGRAPNKDGLATLPAERTAFDAMANGRRELAQGADKVNMSKGIPSTRSPGTVNLKPQPGAPQGVARQFPASEYNPADAPGTKTVNLKAQAFPQGISNQYSSMGAFNTDKAINLKAQAFPQGVARQFPAEQYFNQ